MTKELAVTSIASGRYSGLLAFILPAIITGQALAAQKPPKVDISLHASVSAVAPGKPFEVGLQFEIPEPFHIYWENPGDSGMAPKVTWTVPPGFKVGPIKFPSPKAHVSSGLTTFVLEGTPVLLATVEPPGDFTIGSPIRMTAKVAWLVCDEACFRQDGTAEIKLGTAKEPKLAADDKDGGLMAVAERKLPVPAGAAKYVTLRASATKDIVAQGDSFDVVLDVAVKPGFHVQSNKPNGEFFVAASVFPKVVTGFTPDVAVWPAPRLRRDVALKTEVSEFVGNFQVRVPIKVESPTAVEKIVQGGLFLYQACDEKGRCFQPEAVEWSVPLKSTSVHAEAGSPDDVYVVEAAAALIVDDTPPGALAARDDDAGTREVAGSGNIVQRLLDRLGFVGKLAGAFLGGLILNIMPCVLPVISIKILSFVKQGQESPRRVMRLGLTFAAGILVSFWVIAAVILVVQASAHNVSWGLLFQYPKFVVGMALVMFLFSLNLFGVFEVMLPGSATNTLAGAADREGLPGAFMKGVLATLLATPCTAPFLASAISFALSQTPAVLMGVFTAVGLGMAFPYLLLSARPGWMKLIPKPGTWMITFKQFTGFLLIGAVVWLLWILGKLRGESAIFGAICFMAFLSMAAWLYGRIEFSWPTGRKALTALACVAVLLGGGQFAMSMYDPPPQRELDNSAIADAEIEAAVQQARWQGDGIPWVPYKPGLAEALASKGYTVYVDYTAAWCLTCQVNKKGVLASAAVRKAMADARVIPIKADFTNQDPNISADLKRFESGGVPLNLVYPAGQNTRPIVLPSILTSAAVKEALGKAGPSQIASAAR